MHFNLICVSAGGQEAVKESGEVA